MPRWRSCDYRTIKMRIFFPVPTLPNSRLFITASKRDRTHRVLSQVVTQFQLGMFHETGEPRPKRQCIVASLSQNALWQCVDGVSVFLSNLVFLIEAAKSICRLVIQSPLILWTICSREPNLMHPAALKKLTLVLAAHSRSCLASG